MPRRRAGGDHPGGDTDETTPGVRVRPVGSKYLLEEPLGRGATGTVWRARQREAAGAEAAVPGHPGELVAIKVLKEELAHDPDVVMRFLRERSVLLRLGQDNHSNIVRVRDMVVEGDLLALVMDLVDGPDLHRHLYENGPLTPIAAALLTAQIADALASAHAKGVVHRDLKPANVLLAGGRGDEPLRPMLTDFGIARLADSPGVTRAHEFVGTPSYVAPESAEGRGQTSAVDIYGAGILLYELLTGQPPFRGGSALEVLQRHLSEQPARPEHVPGPLWTVLERCLRKNPADRPSAENLARALRTVAAGISDRAGPDERTAALGVAALLAPPSDPARVPGTGGAPSGPPGAEPTQALPGGSGGFGGTDPNAATSVLPAAGGGPGDPGDRGELDATRAMPAGGFDESGNPGGREEPHPWEHQMRAARDRNEQTAVQPLDPAQDPLYRAPQRRPRPEQQRPPQRPRQAADPGYGRSTPARRSDDYDRPQRYEPEPPRRPERRPEPRPRPRPEPRREPRPPREPRRSANPVRIPGLGCLKGCLVIVLVLAALVFVAWNFTPLPDWIAEGQSFWETVQEWFASLQEMLGFAEGARDTVEDFQDNLPGG